MNNFGFVKTAAGIPFTTVSGINENKNNIITQIKEAYSNKANLIVFPESIILGWINPEAFELAYPIMPPYIFHKVACPAKFVLF